MSGAIYLERIGSASYRPCWLRDSLTGDQLSEFEDGVAELLLCANEFTESSPPPPAPPPATPLTSSWCRAAWIWALRSAAYCRTPSGAWSGRSIFFDHFGPAVLCSTPANASMCGRIRIPGSAMPRCSRRTPRSCIVTSSARTSRSDRAPSTGSRPVAASCIPSASRPTPDHRGGGERLHGLQFWVAIPQADEEIDPSFADHDRQNALRLRGVFEIAGPSCPRALFLIRFS